MFFGAIACVIISVFLVWRIVVTKDLSQEWVIWLLIVIGLFLFGAGYLTENKYRREHSEEYDYSEIRGS